MNQQQKKLMSKRRPFYELSPEEQAAATQHFEPLDSTNMTTAPPGKPSM
jgi:hypothetical protein